MSIGIREIKLSDEDKINELMNKSIIYHKKLSKSIITNIRVRLFGTDTEKQHFRYLKRLSTEDKFKLTNEYVGYICTKNSIIVGFAIGKVISDKEFHICDIFVENKFRKIHIGKSLMRLMYLEAEHKKCSYISLNCFKYNRVGNKFYKKLNYKLAEVKGLVNCYIKIIK